VALCQAFFVLACQSISSRSPVEVQSGEIRLDIDWILSGIRAGIKMKHGF